MNLTNEQAKRLATTLGIRKKMNPIRSWISAKPFTAILLAALFGALSTAAGLREDWMPHLLTLFLAGLVVFTCSVARSLAVLLAISLSCQTKAEEPQPAVAVAAGIVVICVGGFCIYKVAKFCEKHFPKEDKGSNALTGFSMTSSDEYGASWSYNSYGYCYSSFQAASEEEPTTFNLDVIVGAGGTLGVSLKAESGPGTFQTFAEFQREVASHGLLLADHAENSPHFERNRMPCAGENVPISIDPLSKTVTHNTGGAVRQLVVERSVNLVDWFPFLTTNVSEGTGMRMVDTTREGQMFYRVQVIQP